MRKIWPSEDNCIMPNDQFRKVNFTLRKFRNVIFFMVRNFAISQGEFHIAKISQVDLGTLRNSFESPVLRRC